VGLASSLLLNGFFKLCLAWVAPLINLSSHRNVVPATFGFACAHLHHLRVLGFHRKRCNGSLFLIGLVAGLCVFAALASESWSVKLAVRLQGRAQRIWFRRGLLHVQIRVFLLRSGQRD
jgi:hypothetical protein